VDEDISFKKKGGTTDTPDDDGPAGPPPTNRPIVVPAGRRRSSIEDEIFFFGEDYVQVTDYVSPSYGPNTNPPSNCHAPSAYVTRAHRNRH